MMLPSFVVLLFLFRPECPPHVAGERACEDALPLSWRDRTKHNTPHLCQCVHSLRAVANPKKNVIQKQEICIKPELSLTAVVFSIPYLSRCSLASWFWWCIFSSCFCRRKKREGGGRVFFGCLFFWGLWFPMTKRKGVKWQEKMNRLENREGKGELMCSRVLCGNFQDILDSLVALVVNANKHS